MAETNKEVLKIVVKATDELTDVISQISASKAGRVLLTFVEGSDLLISPISLKVILKECDQTDKVLFCQIIDNPVGARNAREAGIPVTERADAIPAEIWDETEEDMLARIQERKDRLKGRNMRSVEETLGIVTPLAASTAAGLSASEVADVNEELRESLNDASRSEDQVTGSESADSLDTGETSHSEPSEFEKKINDALNRSKNEIENRSRKVVDAGGVEFALDHDISAAGASAINNAPAASSIGIEKPGQRSLINVDFMNKEGATEVSDSNDDNKTAATADSVSAGSGVVGNLKRSSAATFSAINSEKLKSGSAGVLIKIKAFAARFKGKALLLFIPIVLIMLIGFYFYYQLVPRATVEIYVQSNPVSYEGQFTGDPTVQAFDSANSKIMVKKETIEKERSESSPTSGLGIRGEKATGVIRVTNNGTEDYRVPAGTTVTSSNGKQFVTTQQYEVPSDATESVAMAVEAVDIGTDYNIPAISIFSIQGFSQLGAKNLVSFAGGSREEFSAVAQSDIDKVVGPLKEQIANESDKELRSKATGGWEIVESTISHSLDGEPVPDKAVGAEADIVNIKIKHVSTALYYKKSDIEDRAEELLTKKAEEEDLFESSEEISLKLDSDVEEEISVASVEGETVTVSVKLQSVIRPAVNEDDIEDELRGRGWNSGVNYVKNLADDISTKDPKFTYSPEWMPGFLKRFPNRNVVVRVVNEKE